MILVPQILPVGWQSYIASRGRVGFGLDVGTTEKAKSNPSVLSVVQESGLDYMVRLVLRYKSKDPAITRALLQLCLALPHGLKPTRLCIDATSERYFAADVKKALRGLVITELVVSSESIEHRGEKMNYKSFLGNQLVNLATDGHLGIPRDKWIEADLRSVKTEKGSFYAEVLEDGGHGDVFDSIKLGIHSLRSGGGPAKANAAGTGSLGQRTAQGSAWKNPYANKHENNRRKVCS